MRWKQKCIDNLLGNNTINIFNDQDEKVLDRLTKDQVKYVYQSIQDCDRTNLQDCLIDPFCIISNKNKDPCGTCKWGNNHGGRCELSNKESDWAKVISRLKISDFSIVDCIGTRVVKDKINDLFRLSEKVRVYRKLTIGKPSNFDNKILPKLDRKLIINKGVKKDVTHK
jgi:hypothetical protein